MGIKLERFCCCCTLRTGSLVIGNLGWVFVFAQIFNVVQEHNYVHEDELMRSPYTSNVYYTKIGYIIGSALVSTLLIYGVYKANRGFILPWLVLKGVEVGLFSIATVILFIFGCMGYGPELFAMFIGIGLAAALYFYFWLCVWSHYNDIGETTPALCAPAYTAPYDSSCPPKYVDEMKYNPV